MTYSYYHYFEWDDGLGVAHVYVADHSYNVWQWWYIPGTIT